jgi:hypothetical protein
MPKGATGIMKLAKRFSLATLFVVVSIIAIGMAIVHYAAHRSLNDLCESVVRKGPPGEWGIAGEEGRQRPHRVH